ncbi:MAG: DUF1566 domain-containing protein [Nitrospina sp.]|jgi:hypothetical protein|nr:DUF1566 domain-containing protein [Nitrospina sp.]MBT3415570.1 DUF1566 domain-containing protein [Nitrospina sp.]MBT3856645.1 DUF1566 domain-containing protein [Nitrospina sp.]MBT4103542.1 DUF1566 domain-containing protein [Nitrospina sp.]MBT4388751.1 DUF1566 domain-containing protein [Nitrospina sp.]
MSQQNRFQDNSSGVITDTKYNKYWLPKDSWGDLGQWRNFNEAKSYTQLMNQVYAGGFSDWRLPTLEEAKSLYDQALGQRDWDDEAVFIDALFVTKCANFMWTSETNDKQEVGRINLRNGEVEFIDPNTQEHQSARLVRDIPTDRQLEANHDEQ